MAFVFAVMGFAIYSGLKGTRKSGELMQSLADEFRLELLTQPPVLGIFKRKPEVEGMWRGRRVRFHHYTTGSGKNQTTWAELVMGNVAGSALELSLGRQGLGSKLRAVFGAKEIRVGDSRFDEQWFIETNKPEFVQAAFIGELREAIESSQPRKPQGKYELSQGEVTYTEQGTINTPERRDRMAKAVIAADLLLNLAAVEAEHTRAGKYLG